PRSPPPLPAAAARFAPIVVCSAGFARKPCARLDRGGNDHAVSGERRPEREEDAGKLAGPPQHEPAAADRKHEADEAGNERPQQASRALGGEVAPKPAMAAGPWAPTMPVVMPIVRFVMTEVSDATAPTCRISRNIGQRRRTMSLGCSTLRPDHR